MLAAGGRGAILFQQVWGDSGGLGDPLLHRPARETQQTGPPTADGIAGVAGGLQPRQVLLDDGREHDGLLDVTAVSALNLAASRGTMGYSPRKIPLGWREA